MDYFNLFYLSFALLGLTIFSTFLALFLRRVVPTNEVHIVQTSKRTISYGKDTKNGNTYYEWPPWVPFLGITRISLPVSVFDLDLANYEAYDQGRLPFVVDVKAFFRVSDSDVAAQRVSSFKELHEQLKAVVQGAVRTILASNEIEEIMQGRSKFGNEFTKEVSSQLSQWGITTVKNIELMDIRDHKDSNVIRNIMEKKKSHIEMQSRTEVAKNQQAAKTAEIAASREIELQTQAAQQQIGLRKAEVTREVGIANQLSLQGVKEAEKLTTLKEMAVKEVSAVRQAEITKNVILTEAEQNKQMYILNAEAGLETKKREAEAILLEGNAKAAAEKAMQLAPVEAQIVLAKEIGENKEYQKYLVTIRQVESNQAVGIEQARALEKANIKIIANSGDMTSGINSIPELLSSKGGTALASMVEGFAASETGEAVVTKLTNRKGRSE